MISIVVVINTKFGFGVNISLRASLNINCVLLVILTTSITYLPPYLYVHVRNLSMENLQKLLQMTGLKEFLLLDKNLSTSLASDLLIALTFSPEATKINMSPIVGYQLFSLNFIILIPPLLTHHLSLDLRYGSIICLLED